MHAATDGGMMDRDGVARRGVRGVTLFELLIVLAITAILAAIAYPAYTDALRKGRRSDAVTSLLQVQLEQERFRTTNQRYAERLTELGRVADEMESPAGYYRIALEPVADPRVAFRARATPAPRSDQNNDRCLRFVLDEQGPNLADSSGPACWPR
jgi:type IV pilus assembly protein PilE